MKKLYTFNPGGTGVSIVVSPSITSTYTISGTSTQGCNNSTVFTQSVSTCADISELQIYNSNLSIYPNPTNDKVIIYNALIGSVVEIYNALGYLIYTTIVQSEKTEISLENKIAGIYFIRNGSQIKKI